MPRVSTFMNEWISRIQSIEQRKAILPKLYDTTEQTSCLFQGRSDLKKAFPVFPSFLSPKNKSMTIFCNVNAIETVDNPNSFH